MSAEAKALLSHAQSNYNALRADLLKDGNMRSLKSSPESALQIFQSPDLTHVLLDCDGVVYSNKTAIPGSPDMIKALEAMGKKVLFVTNSSGKSR